MLIDNKTNIKALAALAASSDYSSLDSSSNALMFSKMVNAAALSASAVSVYGALGCPQCIWSNDHW